MSASHVNIIQQGWFNVVKPDIVLDYINKSEAHNHSDNSWAIICLTGKEWHGGRCFFS